MVKGNGDVEFDAEDRNKRFYDRKLRQLTNIKADIQEVTGSRRRLVKSKSKSRTVRGLDQVRRASDTSEASIVSKSAKFQPSFLLYTLLKLLELSIFSHSLKVSSSLLINLFSIGLPKISKAQKNYQTQLNKTTN